MAKVIDLTDKLNFDKKPEIRIGETVIEVNDDAKTVLQIMVLTTDEEATEMEQITKGIDLLFDKKNRKKLDDMKLSFRNYVEIFKTAMELATGTDGEEQGEAQTHTTT